MTEDSNKCIFLDTDRYACLIVSHTIARHLFHLINMRCIALPYIRLAHAAHIPKYIFLHLPH